MRAMSQENVEIVSQAISAINERDVDAYLALCHTDFEMTNQLTAIEGPNRGEQGIRSFFDSINEGTSRFELEVERLRPLDDNRVLGSLTLDIESEGGYRDRQALTNLYELEGGKLSRVKVFSDRAEALEAAGLSE